MDDWSLKGKGWIYDYHGAGLGLRINNNENELASDDCHLLNSELYLSANIDTLRQKLAEDFLKYAEKYHIICTMEFCETINKRFGVDE